MFKSCNNSVMVADGDLLYVDFFFPWLQKDCESLHDEILARMALFVCRCLSYGISALWRSIFQTASVSVIASGIGVIFFLSENTTVQTEFFCEYAHFINMAFHCIFKFSDTKADK